MLLITTTLGAASSEANVWAFLITMLTVLGATVASILSYLSNRSARATAAKVDDIAEKTTTNRNSDGHMGLAVDQLSDKLDEIITKVDRVEGQQATAHRVLGKVVKDVRETKHRVSQLERPPVDFDALEAELND